MQSSVCFCLFSISVAVKSHQLSLRRHFLRQVHNLSSVAISSMACNSSPPTVRAICALSVPEDGPPVPSLSLPHPIPPSMERTHRYNSELAGNFKTPEFIITQDKMFPFWLVSNYIEPEERLMSHITQKHTFHQVISPADP